MLLLRKYWFEITIALSVLMISGYVLYLQNTIQDLEKDNLILKSRVKENQAYIMAQNIAIASNRADYKVAMERLPTVLHEINTKYKTAYQTIYAWKDSNETNDCNQSMAFINNFKF